MQRDRATAVCCAYVWKVYCAVVRTLFQTWRHSAVVIKVVAVCAQCSECQREEIQKARVNDGSNYDSLKPLTNAHHGKQIISSTRPSW